MNFNACAALGSVYARTGYNPGVSKKDDKDGTPRFARLYNEYCEDTLGRMEVAANVEAPVEEAGESEAIDTSMFVKCDPDNIPAPKLESAYRHPVTGEYICELSDIPNPRDREALDLALMRDYCARTGQELIKTNSGYMCWVVPEIFK